LVFADDIPVVARFREVSLRGVARIKFADKIKIPVNYTEMINEGVLEIKVVSKSISNERNKNI
jgi:hypothetical protein